MDRFLGVAEREREVGPDFVMELRMWVKIRKHVLTCGKYSHAPPPKDLRALSCWSLVCSYHCKACDSA